MKAKKEDEEEARRKGKKKKNRERNCSFFVFGEKISLSFHRFLLPFARNFRLFVRDVASETRKRTLPHSNAFARALSLFPSLANPHLPRHHYSLSHHHLLRLDLLLLQEVVRLIGEAELRERTDYVTKHVLSDFSR